MKLWLGFHSLLHSWNNVSMVLRWYNFGITTLAVKHGEMDK